MVLQHSVSVNINQSSHEPSEPQTGRVPVAFTADPATLDWMGLASNLGPPIGEGFVTATNALLPFLSLNPSEFVQYCRKIIALIELARRTLVHHGVGIYPFSRCPAQFIPYKTAYTGLIKALRERQNDIPSSLQARVRVLLLPLSSNLHIRKAGSKSPMFCMPLPQGGTALKKLRGSRTSPAASVEPSGYVHPLRRATQPLPQCMAPPGAYLTRPNSHKEVVKSLDALSPKVPKRLWSLREGWDLAYEFENARGSRKGGKRRKGNDTVLPAPSPSPSWGETPLPTYSSSSISLVKVSPSDAGGANDENAMPVVGYRVIRRIPRRFGIFCTPKASMHGPNPAATRAASWRQA